MKKAFIMKSARFAWAIVRNARSECIRISPCDPLPVSGTKSEAASAPPLASIRVIRGQYTWSIPVRMFGAVERAVG